MSLARNMTALVAALVLLGTACSASAEVEPVASTAAAISLETTTSTTGAPGTTATVVAAVELPSLADLEAAVAASIAEPGAEFELVATQTIPGLFVASTVRRGRYDDTTSTGTGSLGIRIDDTLENDPKDPGLLALIGEPFEFRLVGSVMWVRLPDDVDPSWSGWSLEDYTRLLGGDPRRNVDGDRQLRVVMDATVNVVNFLERDDGSSVWVVSVRADDLLPVVATGAVQRRILDSGFMGTGAEVTATYGVDASSRVVRFTVDLDDWWAAVITSLLGIADDDVALRVGLSLGFVEIEPATAPCDDPVSDSTEDGATVLRCP